ncbi:MAG: hypothetical protein JW893_09410 [Candidatus Omnitrophica bacterium]|nr:hypothetical protein [Candidatus Omnitrophota bacterium]
MVVLILLFCLVFPSYVSAHPFEQNSLEVIYDRGDPDNSVGIVGETILEKEDYFEGYRVRAFEDNAIIFEDLRTLDSLKIVTKDEIEPKILQYAQNVFIAKQMKAIHEAQVQYVSQFRDAYADSLEELRKHGFLKNGFEQGVKQGYFFEIVEATKKFNETPTYLAVASPVEEGEGKLFFAVDQLGEVRFGESRFQVPWGPAWNYKDHGVLHSQYIGVDPPDK